MASIYPVSDLRDYDKVLQECEEGRPVYLTRNGRGRYVLLDMAEYEQQQAQLALFAKLAEGEASIRQESDWLSTEDVRKRLEV